LRAGDVRLVSVSIEGRPRNIEDRPVPACLPAAGCRKVELSTLESRIKENDALGREVFRRMYVVLTPPPGESREKGISIATAWARLETNLIC
jgi:hypothetical protein